MSLSVTPQYSAVANDTLDYLPTIVAHEGYYEVAQLLMVALSASDVSSLLVALHIQPSTSLCQRYRRFLHPIRDIDPTMRIFDTWIREKCQILLLGHDCRLLMQRIMDPEAYYAEGSCTRDPLEIWVVALPPNSQRIAKRASRLLRVFHRTSNRARRTRAFSKFRDIIDQGLILKQYLDGQDLKLCEDRPIVYENIHGQSVHVKAFDLLLSTTMNYDQENFVVGLHYAGLEFRLAWDIRASKSARHWKAADGLPYIDTANPYHLGRGATIDLNERERPNAGTLAFFPYSPRCCRESILSIPIKQVP
ncbi:hypothetical protein BDV38DRAFT_289232 [Aspergillus pseudotamarii]|uniref:Uncharacterized protein n=1 Tax=Aspergillus pseudotamarii TaxID=132259 RepID=A0A5N6S869_ASPPS|nr:uncharacterized protein BDV38DRAFT_289232 [Aspergillus pseudotamarii]KAE8130866.1 hypothetical protein BDV38DRAFT_289232 [Aspergillus pseudotamarii]